jgi:hypothetical protein
LTTVKIAAFAPAEPSVSPRQRQSRRRDDASDVVAQVAHRDPSASSYANHFRIRCCSLACAVRIETELEPATSYPYL